MLDPRSWAKSGKGLETGGEAEDELSDRVLSEGAKGLGVRWWPLMAGGVGGARPLPLPKMRPPPSLRPDIVEDGRTIATRP